MDPKSKAEYVAYNAAPRTAELILALGQDHLRSQHASSIALDSRCAHVAAIQMTAIALALAFIASGRATQISAILIVIAAAAFSLGAVTAFHVVLSGHQKLPGVPPHWWYSEQNKTPSIKTVRCWAAGEIQDSVDFNNRANNHKGDTLNRSIHLSFLGVVFTFMAVIAQFI